MAVEVFGQTVENRIDSVAELRAEVGSPSPAGANKVIDHVDDLARRFIAAAPLAILGTRRADGTVDLTPRGDPPGFVQVLDPHTMAMPDRPGNNRMDGFSGILETGAVSLLFMIPGHNDTLRVAGQAALVKDTALSGRMAVHGKPSGHCVLIRVERVMCHCPKAFVRGKVWRPEDWPDTSDVPTLAEMVKAHGDLTDPLADLEHLVETSVRETLY